MKSSARKSPMYPKSELPPGEGDMDRSSPILDDFLTRKRLQSLSVELLRDSDTRLHNMHQYTVYGTCDGREVFEKEKKKRAPIREAKGILRVQGSKHFPPSGRRVQHGKCGCQSLPQWVPLTDHTQTCSSRARFPLVLCIFIKVSSIVLSYQHTDYQEQRIFARDLLATLNEYLSAPAPSMLVTGSLPMCGPLSIILSKTVKKIP
ncbi:hypothetical protein GWK47_053836 [Chionoecetes opilio]|uniref:Uncharacterized protein n=1 Tax=Chionoecetes opilio TaxID=41210 RepID=A0A8J5C8G4_CHIOP|nr:hypothetical protein GWK47_053836 [Chionoecetes opilio]